MPFGLPSLSNLPSLPGRAKEQASLDDVLPSTTEKAELLVLVSTCTSRMRQAVQANFDATPSEQASQASHGEPDGTAQQTRVDPGWTTSLGLTSDSLEELREPTLSHFDKWRQAVLNRMQEALKIDKSALAHAQSAYARQSTNSKPILSSHNLSRVRLPASLQKSDEKARALVLGAVLFMLLSLESYEAESSVLTTYLCDCMELPQDVIRSLETTTAKTLLDAAAKSGSELDAEDARKQKADEGMFNKKWKVGLATVAGAAIIGISGGLAAPVILGLAGSILGGVGLGGVVTFLGATIVNPVTIGAIFGYAGGRMGKRTMETYTKEVEDFKFLAIDELKPHVSQQVTSADSTSTEAPIQKLRCAIGISGWVTKEDDVWNPWRVFSTVSLEAFALRYEQAALISLGTTLSSILKSTGFGYVRGKAIKFLLPSLAAAMAPYGMLGAGKFLDNPFTIAMDRSDKAGKILARALVDRVQGKRPVTLIGFSMGARVVYACLEELAALKAYGIVEDAIFIGSPIPSSENAFRRMHAVVAGRLVNVYSDHDFLLSYLYRFRNAQLGVAGLQAINVPTVENLDASDFVAGHNQYCLAIGRILKELKFADLDMDEVKREGLELEREKIYEDQVHDEAKKDGRLSGIEDENGQILLGEMRNDESEVQTSAQADDKSSTLAKQLDETHIDQRQAI